jgi:5-methyltetrahydropteroyltriglutamate--homocysteine methyltransferase
MVESCDVGSLPFSNDLQKLMEGASNYGQVINDLTEFFENKVVAGFLDKLNAGIEVPNYPQQRDMIQMFFNMIEGFEKVNGGYMETAPLSVRPLKAAIPEALAIRNRANYIYEKIGSSFKVRICITGPYTMSSMLTYKNKGTFFQLGTVLAQIAEANIFSNKHGKVRMVSVDEPVFGFIDDPLLDRGSESRENLRKAWEMIMQKIKANSAQACLHLHNTSDELFWEVNGLDIIESHVDDPLYQVQKTKQRLESADKFLKASLAVTDFDQLIQKDAIAISEQKLSEAALNEKIAEIWKALDHRQVDPAVFLEKTSVMQGRLKNIIEAFGDNRVLYAGPECGLRSFPTYESALECLRRVSEAVRSIRS